MAPEIPMQHNKKTWYVEIEILEIDEFTSDQWNEKLKCMAKKLREDHD